MVSGLRQLVEHGGAVPSIEAICAHAGYTRGAFYVYFKDRRDFVVQRLDWVFGDIFENLFRNVGDETADIQTIIARFTDALASRDWPDVPDIRSAYLSVIAGLRDSEGIRQRHADLMTAAIGRLETALREGQQTGRIRETIDPGKVAQIVLLIGIGEIVWDDVGIPIDQRALSEHFLSLIEKRGRR
jgi:AcrR family transcriptional regulator